MGRNEKESKGIVRKGMQSGGRKKKKRIVGRRMQGGKEESERRIEKMEEGEGDGKMYREAKGRYKRMLGDKRREENEKWVKEVGEIKTEGQVWVVVGRERRRRMVNEGISMEEWDGFFSGLLGGVEGRVVRGTGRGVREDGEEDISREEIKGVKKIIRRWGRTRYRQRFGSIEGRGWRSGFGNCVIEYGGGRDG